MAPCIVEIDLSFEVNRCRNEDIIVKRNFGWAWPMWAGRPRVGNGAMHKVQYQFEVNRKGNFGWAWPMWAWRSRINCIVIREVQYQFEVNRLKGNFGWAWPMWALLLIDRIVIREVQYQFEVNRLKGNFGWAWPMWPGRPRIDLIVIREAQYQFKVNRCRNEEVNFQGSSANSVGEAGGQDGRTDAHQYNIPTLSPKKPFLDREERRVSTGDTPFQSTLHLGLTSHAKDELVVVLMYYMEVSAGVVAMHAEWLFDFGSTGE
ncbi:hypothetical protein DPMN_008975 [Dreissena polymorpha]|uniref:Uncharacterized protein n=1 Tax=Dreissena polymorpha TaxID=45954 RepID=A0A9D4MW80_DREPO|nr:hypothetical protein DPMN_008975 [Dreissena polymorpha]